MIETKQVLVKAVSVPVKAKPAQELIQKPIQEPVQKPVQKPIQELAKHGIAQKSIQKLVKIGKISAESIWLQVLVEFIAIVVALILAIAAWVWIRKRLFKQIEAATNEQINAIGHNTFQVSSSSFDINNLGIFGKEQHSILSVEEINSVVEEAKILVSMDRPAGAISLLLNHIGDKPKASLHPWLCLLDLYRSQGQKDEFEAVAKRLHTTFNVMTPQWEETEAPMVVANSLEEFPHIISQLEETCATGESQEYLAGLLEDNREGERAGFSLNVLEDIMLLKDVSEARESISEEAAS